MPRYALTITFTTDRELIMDELCDLEAACRVQIEEPTTLDEDGRDFTEATFTTADITTDWAGKAE